jgi:TRAP-type mannitol/chloroaromatic compound transport system permease small subunit
MHALLQIAAAIDALNRWIGRAVVWLILGAVLVSAATATLRYLLDWGSNSLIEIQWAMFGMVFLLGAAWTLQENGHVRIDLVFARLPDRARVAIDIAGGLLFLLPFSLLVVYDAWTYFLIALGQNEASPNPGGLPWWPMKAVIPLAFGLLALQGVSEIIKGVAVLSGHRPMPPSRPGH